VQTLPIVQGQQPVDIARRALNAAKLQGFDVLLLDTAGRLHVDQALMDEMKAVASVSEPDEILLVVDCADRPGRRQRRQELLRSGEPHRVVLTRMDGDARGGAALSMRAVTGKPIKFVGTGEKLDGLELFQPGRVAGRILGMGDVVSLVERAAETIKQEDAEKPPIGMSKGQFDLNDLRSQLNQMRRMGRPRCARLDAARRRQGEERHGHGHVDDKVLIHMGCDHWIDDAQGARQARAASTPSARSGWPRGSGTTCRRSTRS